MSLNYLIVVIRYLSVEHKVKGLFVAEFQRQLGTSAQEDVLSCLRFRANELLMMEIWIAWKDCEELVLFGGHCDFVEAS